MAVTTGLYGTVGRGIVISLVLTIRGPKVTTSPGNSQKRFEVKISPAAHLQIPSMHFEFCEQTSFWKLHA